MHCDMYCRLFHWFLRIGGSASLHALFLHFLAKCFFCNLFWGVFLGGGNKCVGVNVSDGQCWNGMCSRMVRVV